MIGHVAHMEHLSRAGTLPGLAVTDAGYALQPSRDVVPAGSAVPFSFRIVGPQGEAVRRYVRAHEKDLHLVVVRRDLAAFQHVHPVLSADGVWSVSLNLTGAGGYRVFADFEPAGLGDGLTLGVDLSVGGQFTPIALPAPADTAGVEDYEVALIGAPVAGQAADMTFTIARAGHEVTDLQPYLGAFGHLVSLRAGDLAYLHTHPSEEAHAGGSGGPTVSFMTSFPTPGSYRLFLDFRHAGTVRTAAFTVTVAAPPPDGH